MNMKLSDWAHIAEIIGGIAIIASLIFVGVQIQENSRAVRSNTFQSITETDMNWLENLVDDPELAIAWNKMLIDHTQLEAIEWARLDWVITMLMRNFENIFEQYQAGTLTEARWQSVSNIVDYVFSTAGMYCWYREADNPQLFTGEFGDVMREAYDESPIANQELDCPDLPALIKE
jgi:hypothetical protein